MPYNQHAGIGEETTWGTAVARTKFAKVMEGSFLNHRIERSPSAKLAANVGADAETVFDSQQTGVGKLIVPAAYDDGMFLKILKHGMGLLATTGAGPYVHTFTRKVGPPFAAGSVPTAVGLTAELNYELPDAGPLEARLLTGARVNAFRLSWEAGGELFCDADLLGKEVTQVIKSAGVTFPDYDLYEMGFAQGTISINGTQFGSVIASMEVNVNNGHEPRMRFAGTNFTAAPLRRGKADISGTIRMDWEASPSAKTLWDAFKAKAASNIVVTFTGPTNYSMVVTMQNVQFTGGDLSPEEGQLQSVEFPFICLHNATHTALKIAVQNQTATV